MKRNLLAAIPLAACAAFGSSAMAEDITFQGEVITNTCVPSVNGLGADATIQLNPVSSNVLPAANTFGGGTNFNIELTGCGTTAPNVVKAYFWQANAENGMLSRNAQGGGTSTGVQFQLMNAAGTDPILVGTTSTILTANNVNDPGVDVGANAPIGEGTLTYGVRYYRNADPFLQGTIVATTTYVLFSS